MLLLGWLVAFTLSAAAGAGSGSTIQTVAGNNAVGDGGAATAAILTLPEGIAVDSSGNLFVADADDGRVRRISPSGMIQTVAGTGYPGFNGEVGLGTEIQLNRPYGVAADKAGNVYIADLGNGRVRKLTPDGKIATVAGGGAAIPSQSADGMPALSVRLIAPRNVTLDASGALYIADFGANQVHRVDPPGVLTVLAGAGAPGFSGDNGLAKLALLFAPAGLAADSTGTVYIADSGNNRVRKVVHGTISTVFQVGTPTGLALNAAGTLYIAGVNYFGTALHAVGGVIQAQDVAADLSGNLYLVSGSQIRRIDKDGLLSVVAGSGASRYYGGDGGPPALARLHTPYAIVQDDLGNTFIADTDNNRIRRITQSGIMTTFGGTGEAGSSTGGGTAMLAQLRSPRGLAVDSRRNLYVADSGNNRILMITPAGGLTILVDKLADPEALAIDQNDTLYIADTGNNRVLKAAAGVVNMVTDVLQPAGLTFDSSGTLYISEKSRVSQLPPGRLLTTVVDGLLNPRGLAVTTGGDLIIAEAGLHRIRVLNARGTLDTVAGTGLPGFTGDDGPATAAQLNTPSGLWVDPSGKIWVADSGNQRIRTLTVSESTLAPPLIELGIVNAATMQPGPVTPNEIVSIFGSGFAHRRHRCSSMAPRQLFSLSVKAKSTRWCLPPSRLAGMLTFRSW